MSNVESNSASERESDNLPTPTMAKIPISRSVPWFDQFYWCLWKNSLLVRRRPIMLVLVLLSSVFAVIVSWAVGGRDPEESDAIYPPESAFTECGSVDLEWLESINDWNEKDKVQITLNENWRDGVEVAMMGLGPMFQAIFIFIVVNEEVHAQLLGVLRALGLRESVYWLAWYSLFAIISFVNALLGAITAKIIPGHVYESVFFGGIFASLFFLNLSLVSASLFLVALCGTGRKFFSNIVILFIILAAFIPLLVMGASSTTPSNEPYFSEYPSGLFWQNKDTYVMNYVYTSSPDGNETLITAICNQPIMNEEQGKWLKTDVERMEVQEDEFFVGCYMKASYPVMVWKQNKAVERFFMFFFPYFHFQNIWGNFVGYTAMPNREFTSEQATMSADELALAALPKHPSPDNGLNTTMAIQGSMFVTNLYYDYNDNSWDKSACPLGNYSGIDLCEYEYTSQCGYAEDPGAQHGAPSVMETIGMLFSLSVIYLLLTYYCAVVFCAGNGRGEKFYFFLLPSYWSLGNSFEEPSEGEIGVTIDGLKKKFGAVEALKGVSFQMNAGEVTALLGHNGAGKTTISNILCCEIGGIEGNVRVFGHSILSDAHFVRGMVGVCKQDDYLWPNLSAKEHLELFASLRGVESANLSATVQNWLQSVDLEDVQLQYSSAFSGGMKRRLSVALATIGDRPLIVLDEPTTGMDPVSRRFVWRHIDAIKEGRVVLLTTHAMEEADLLADEVAIMRQGELAAFGSPLQLKSKHGTALQFSILVDKSRLGEALKYIEDFFAEGKLWTKVEPSDAGSISVKISALKDHRGGEGVDISVLTSFVSWLDSKESPVSEYGFSNSSLEEVFLKVTNGDEEDSRQDATDTTRTTEAVAEEGDNEAALGSNFDNLSNFTAKLTARNQSFVVLISFWRRGWTGRGSIGNYCLYGIFLLGSILLMFGVSHNDYPLPALIFVIFSMSILLIAIIGPVYADRSEGQFYLMRSHGLLPSGYIAGLCLYSFTLQLAYNILTLTGIFASPFFLESEVCDPDAYSGDCSMSGFGDRQEVYYLTEIRNFEDTYEGEKVILKAIRAPGGYGMVFGVALSAAFATMGQTLTTAFFPGNRLPLVMIMVLTMIVSVLPILPFLLFMSEQSYWECSNTTNPDFVCDDIFSRENANEAFVNCVGFEVNSDAQSSFCVPPSAALLSHFGIYQMLSMAYMSKITFLSEPEGYVQNVLIPAIEGANCKDDTCVFPFANNFYGLNFLFTGIGGVILIIIGILIAYMLAFPVGPFLRLRQMIPTFFASYCCSRHSSNASSAQMREGEELPEVGEERAAVHAIVKPLLVHNGADSEPEFPSLDHACIPRDDIDPVVMHKLRKVYPALGGRPPKVALESLDLHVPKGQVLGLLGKNGAGKTTALKILAGAHDSSGGVGLVSGYDCALEKICVFERLGNCAQFDVVWKSQTVQRHLEFFAALKGLPKKEIKKTAKAIAVAVGLGSDSVFTRNAGSLSGGMRRRLSIGMALIGSPGVVILDEPTTGLDPSTRATIWSLINSFASKDRSMIITTHMMIEADTLCNRIAIVSQGDLVVIGTQQYLKNKFGDGYMLQLNLVHSSPEYQERAMDFVRKRLHPDARLGMRQAKTLRVNLPRGVNLEEVFRALYSEERISEGGINQFLLSQSSLEDVFISLGDSYGIA